MSSETKILNENITNFKIYKNQVIQDINTPWIDDIFPPNENSLLGKNIEGEYIDPNEGKYKMIHSSDIEWKRISDIIPHPVIYEDSISTSNIRYGRLSYQYFYSVLTSLTKFPSLFNKIIINKEYNPNGIYEIILFIDGEFQKVYIDDYFPCLKNSNILYFIKPSNFEIWPLLIEKAWAKVNGGYQNIINSWPIDFFRALTGSACDVLIHEDLSNDELFHELNFADKNNGLCISLTKNRNDVTIKGLINHHMYILVETEKIEIEKNNILFLCKFSDPTGETEWGGDWGEKSKLWNEEIKKKINSNKLELKKGEFWISIEDVKKYFLRSDICHMIFDGCSKTFELNNSDYDKENIIYPKVYNFHVQEEGMLSISLFDKNWNYHRELRDIQNPKSLIIAEYDNITPEIKNLFTKYESNEILEITKTFQKGYYLVWLYQMNNLSDDNTKIRFCSDTKMSAKYIGNDNNFELIKYIILNTRKKINLDKLNNNEVFYESKNSFEKSGLGYTLCINPLNNIYQEWNIRTDKLEGYYLLYPNNKKEFNMKINNNDSNLILGIKKQKFGEHWFNLNIEVSQYENKIDETKEIKETAQEENNEKKINIFFSKDNKNFELINVNSTFSYEEIKTGKKYPLYDHWSLFLEKYKTKYPHITNELEQLEQLDNEQLDLIEIQKDNNIYIGEADYIIRNGRGALIFGDGGAYFVGYWDNGRQYKRGKVFDKDNNLIYDGEYKKGLKDGNGVYYYPNGEKYEGKFCNGIREGKGTFFWKDGSRWEGYFKNDEMNGEGIFYKDEESYTAIYKDGQLIEN